MQHISSSAGSRRCVHGIILGLFLGGMLAMAFVYQPVVQPTSKATLLQAFKDGLKFPTFQEFNKNATDSSIYREKVAQLQNEHETLQRKYNRVIQFLFPNDTMPRHTSVYNRKRLLSEMSPNGSAVSDSRRFYSPWEKQRQKMYNPNCEALYQGDLQEAKRIREQLIARPYTEQPAVNVSRWTADCKGYRPFVEFRNKYVTQEEHEFPVAFSIRMHKSVEQAEQLLRRIYAPQNIYCIYIDKKSPVEIHSAMKQIASCFANVFIATKLENFYYTSTSHIKADMQCMNDTLHISSKWKYFINLVGEDFPTKTNLELVRILKMLNGSNGIDSGIVNPGQLDDRIRNVYKIQNGGNSKTGMRRPAFDETTKFYKGAEYSLFSRDFVKWTLNADYPRRLFKYFDGGTYASDEIYWATLNHHAEAPGGYTFLSARFAKARIWVYGHGERRDDNPCRSIAVRAICIFSVTELLWLTKQQEPFANKFKIETDPIALDCMGELLVLKQVTKHVEDLSYLQYNPVIYDKVFYKKAD